MSNKFGTEPEDVGVLGCVLLGVAVVGLGLLGAGAIVVALWRWALS